MSCSVFYKEEGFREGLVLRRGSKKGLSRRHLEGRNTPFREYDHVGVRPMGVGVFFPPFKSPKNNLIQDS